jgi:hypothetical protein
MSLAVRTGGERLGEVRGCIVGEVLIGIISADPESYLSLEPHWEQPLPRNGERYKLRDVLVPA